MNIKIALKSGSYNLDLDRVKLSLGIFFFSDLFIGEVFLPAFRIYLYFCQNTHQKAESLMVFLILPVAKVPWWFLGVQYMQCVLLDGLDFGQGKKYRRTLHFDDGSLTAARRPGHGPPQYGTKCCHKNSVPVTPPTCQHLLGRVCSRTTTSPGSFVPLHRSVLVESTLYA